MFAARNKPDMLRWTSIAAAVAVLVVSGWVHGRWSGRWQQSNLLEEAVARVDQVPREVGDWTGHDLEADEASFFQAGAQGYWTRQYTHSRSKVSLLVILMCGRSGRMSVHTPEVCYQGAGYAVVENAAPWNVHAAGTSGQDMASFWSARFRKEGALASHLRLVWGWNARGAWQAPANPRWEFQGEPFLYKLYVSQELSGADAPLAREFMEEFLPVLDRALFPSIPEES